MSIVELVMILVLIGIGLYVLNHYAPMDSKIKGILNIVVVVLVILWLLQVFGIWHMGHVPKFGHR